MNAFGSIRLYFHQVSTALSASPSLFAILTAGMVLSKRVGGQLGGPMSSRSLLACLRESPHSQCTLLFRIVFRIVVHAID